MNTSNKPHVQRGAKRGGTNSKSRSVGWCVVLVGALLGTAWPICLNAQGGTGSSGSAIIPGACQVPSQGGSLRGDPALSTGSLSFGIPSPAGIGTFDTERLDSPGPFGNGTVLFPTATSVSVDLGAMILPFANGASSYRRFGDRRTLSGVRQGMSLFDPNQGTTFFEQRIANGHYAISRIEGLDKSVPAVFSYSPGAAVPSSISLNGGEKKISIEQNGSGNITRISFEGMVATYSYISSGSSNLLSEVKVDGNSVLKLTWEQGLPTSARNAHGEVEMYAFMRKWDDPGKFALAGLVGRDGTVSTIEYTNLTTIVRVDGVPYKYEWAKNPVSGNTFARAIYRADRLLGASNVDPSTGRMVAEEDEFGAITSYSWDTNSSAVPREVRLPDGTTITNTVNGNDDVIHTAVKSPGGIVTTHSYSYDPARRLLRYEVKDSTGDSSAATSYTYSGARLSPDGVTAKEVSTVRFSPRGRVESIARLGERRAVSANDGGRRLVLSSNGVPTQVNRGASKDGIYSLSMTSPLVKVNSKSDPLRGSESYETFRLGRKAGGGGPALASTSNSGLMTYAFATDTGGSWLPYETKNTTRNGKEGNYTFESTTTSPYGTRSEKKTATRQGDGSCAITGSCQAKPSGIEEDTPVLTQTPTVSPLPTVQPTVSPLPTVQPTVAPRPTARPTARTTAQPTVSPTSTPQENSPGDCCYEGDTRCCRRLFPGSKCAVCRDAPVI